MLLYRTNSRTNNVRSQKIALLDLPHPVTRSREAFLLLVLLASLEIQATFQAPKLTGWNCQAHLD